jgi:hypothetical protein
MRLASDLRARNVSESEQMKYLLGLQLLSTIFLYQALLEHVAISLMVGYELFVVVIIVIFGVLRCYAENGGVSGEHFVERFICLSFPVTVKVSIVIWVGTYVYQKASAKMCYSSGCSWLDSLDPLVYSAFAAIGAWLYFWRIWVHLRWIRENAGRSDAVSPGS